MIAVKEDAKSLKFVPYRYKNYKICLVAIVESKIKYVHILTYVNEDNMTRAGDIYALASSSGLPSSAAARMTEKEYNDLVFKAVNYDGRALKDVPDNLKTSELCKLAVRYDGIALQYVPINLRTLEICEQAVINSSKAIKYVNDEQMKEYLSIKYEITQDKINNENNENIERPSYYGAPPLSKSGKQYYGKR